MKAYITKYALTSGVEILEVERSKTYPGVVWIAQRSGTQYFHGEGKDWHLNREAAEARVKQMIEQKRKSLQKQMDRLDGLKVSVPSMPE